MDENIRDIDKLAQEVIDDKELLHEVFYKMRKEALDNIDKQGMYKNGIKNEQMKIAKKMLEKGKSIEEIVEITELSKEEIEELTKDL